MRGTKAEPGIVVHAVNDLFAGVLKSQTEQKREFCIRASYLEVCVYLLLCSCAWVLHLDLAGTSRLTEQPQHADLQRGSQRPVGYRKEEPQHKVR